MLSTFISWYFIEKPIFFFNTGKGFFLFSLRYFSTNLLLKTLFLYWRDYKWSYGKSFDLKIYIEAFFSNLLSRIVGGIIRFSLIIIGLILQVLIIISTIAIILFWLLLPIIIVFLFYSGITELKAVDF